MSRLSLYSLVLFAGVGAMAVACGSDDDTTPAGTAGKSSAGAAGKGGAGGGKGGATGVAGEAGEVGLGGEGGAADTLYNRLGGHDGIRAALGAIVAEEVMDSDIASFFAPQLAKGSKHEPTVDDILDCFTALLGTAAEGPGEVYPTKAKSGFQCRSMVDSHADLHIGADTFDNFVSIAAGVLKKAKVADADIAVIGSVLNGTKDDIVDLDAPASGPCVSPACMVGDGGAGGEGGTGGAN
ncbi:MAG: hypothetical protein ABIQ16_05495 [Polyangiaceae bacterium]